MNIRFNHPFVVGTEMQFIQEAIEAGRISGNGRFTQLCHQFFREQYGCLKALMTTSCTDALEMAAILSEVGPGDEVIVPSFTFVSTANAFVLRGAKAVFADCESDFPNIDSDQIESLINENTKAISVVHYAGAACEMDKIMEIAAKHNLLVIEDAAQAIDSTYKGQQLGTIGHLSTFSFHETKNIISGEGGMLLINDPQFVERSEIIWEKGTNRAAFYRGETDKYTWVDLGSSFLPSELNAAFLYGQLQEIESIQAKRVSIWNQYHSLLSDLERQGNFEICRFKSYQTNNAHMFYLLTRNPAERNELLPYLKAKGVNAVFHYVTLHDSPFYVEKHDGRSLPNAERFASTLVRLPMHCLLTDQEIEHVCDSIKSFYLNR